MRCIRSAMRGTLCAKVQVAVLSMLLLLQDTGALVKAHMMGILNYHSSSLSPLYFLVKLWAQAHDLNDASRSTFNSTSLL